MAQKRSKQENKKLAPPTLPQAEKSFFRTDQFFSDQFLCFMMSALIVCR